MQVKEGTSRWNDLAGGPLAPPPGASSATAGQSPTRRLPIIHLDGIRIHAIDEDTCIRHILNELAAGSGGYVVTPNIDHLRRCRQDVSYSVLVSEANLVVADGMPVVWASRLQGTALPQRVAGSDLISSLSAGAARQGRSIFLLGGAQGTADAAADILRQRSPALKIAGTFCPPVGFEKDEAELKKIIAVLKEAQPDIVYVALGSPKQEMLIDRLRGELPQAWWLGVGVSFSFLCGDVKRAPVFMRRIGLEWLHRVMQEPSRLAGRYIVGIPFAFSLLFRSALKGIGGRFLHRPAEFEQDPLDDDIAVEKAAQRAAASKASEIEPVPPMQPAPPDNSASASPSGHLHETNSFSVHAGNHGRDKLRGLILLGGIVRQTSLGGTFGRSTLDLPVGNGKTILTRWLDEAQAVSRALSLDHLPVRLLVDINAHEPKSALGIPGSEHYRMERDTHEFRGTGGLLGNIAVDYDDDDLILVGNAAQVLLEPLPMLTLSLLRTRGVVSLIGHRGGEPSGLQLITCRALRLIPRVGFVDMKEQALPSIASRYDVRVVNCKRPTGLAIRTLSDYIAALRALHQPSRAAATDPWAEDWKSTFSIVEGGATVSPSARIHDSVILSGASVEANAVVVRSIVAGPVRRDREVVDQCVEPLAKAASRDLARFQA
jgi:N-acetylglucosaminyldiphosphoundecaprenol N-acetyl-beta-D-mannosaminyltransferase